MITGIVNCARRRRGLPGLFETQYTSEDPNIPSQNLTSRRKKPSRGLLAVEIELYCPEIVYQGIDQPPILFLDQEKTVSLDEEPESAIPSTASTLQYTPVGSKQGGTLFNTRVDKGQVASSHSLQTKEYFLGGQIVPNEVCAVCLEAVEIGSHLRLLPCGHGFHISCITRWLTRGSRCPLCNEQVRLSDNCGDSQTTDSNSYLETGGLSIATFGQIQHRRQESPFTSREMYQEVILQSFERIRLRLYQRYLDKQRKNTSRALNIPIKEETS